MLIKVTDYCQIDERKLMDIYAESNLKNTEFFCPEVTDKKAAVKEVEAGFLAFLKNDFLAGADNSYWILEEKRNMGQRFKNQPFSF